MNNEPSHEPDRSSENNMQTPETANPQDTGQPVTLPIVDSKPKWYKRKLIWVSLIIVMLVAGAGTGYAYYAMSGKQDRTMDNSSESSSQPEEKQAADEPSAQPIAEQTKSPEAPESDVLSTYKSKSLGVTFDYPSTWTVKQNSNKVKFFRSYGDRMLVISPSGFTMFLNTIPYGDLGGTGGCNAQVKEFKHEGNAELAGAYVVSYVVEGTFVLKLSIDATAKGAKQDCGMYNGIIKVREPTQNSEGYDNKPYAVQFGTMELGEDTVSTTKPGDQEYKEAVAILKSLRKY